MIDGSLLRQRDRFFGRTFLSGFLVVVTSGFSASAADIELVMAGPVASEDGVSIRGCNLRLSGPIGSGDAEALETALEDYPAWAEKQSAIPDRPEPPVDALPPLVLCLEGPGGNYAEAVRLARIIRTKEIGTHVEPNRTCVSACALTFLAGTVRYYEGEIGRWRFIAPSARLGFHAVSLNIAEGDYDAQAVAQAYALASEAIGDLVSLLQVGDGLAGGGGWLEPSLVATILSTPSTTMRYVETVEDAGRWDISVSPLPPVSVNARSASIACHNAFAWSDIDTGAPFYDVGGDRRAADDFRAEAYPFNDQDRRETGFQLPFNELRNVNCRAVVSGLRPEVHNTSDASGGGPALSSGWLAFYPHDRAIATLSLADSTDMLAKPEASGGGGPATPPAEISNLASQEPPSQVDGDCRNGMQWIGGWAGAALVDAIAHASYRTCDGKSGAVVRLECDPKTGDIAMTVLPDFLAESRVNPQDIEITIDGTPIRLARQNGPKSNDVGVFGVGRGSGLLELLKQGSGARLDVGIATFDFHLTGSSRAIEAMNTACTAQTAKLKEERP